MRGCSFTTMVYPDCTDLEWLVCGISHDPTAEKLDECLENPEPFTRLDALDISIQLLWEEMFGVFLHPAEGIINCYYQTQRLERLADGVYDVLIPSEKVEIGGATVVVPETHVQIEHRRTHHSTASFDVERLKREKAEGYELVLSQDVLGFVEKLVNLSIGGRHFSSVFSTFHMKIPALEGWEEANREVERIHTELQPYLERRKKKINGLLEGNTSLDTIVRLIAKEDEQVTSQYRNAAANFRAHFIAQTTLHEGALTRLINEYAQLISTRPFVFQYWGTAHLNIDCQGRVIYSYGVGPERQITFADIGQALFKHIESLPFNEQFHRELRTRLLTNPPERKDYEQRSRHILYEAYRLLDERHPTAAILRAATAFEVILRGFLIEKQIAKQEEFDRGEHKLHYMLGPLFDKAVRTDPEYKGRGKYVFDPRIKRKIVSAQQETNKMYPTLQDIRNAQVHFGVMPRNGRASDCTIAQAVCDTYAEAISYILERGWRSGERVNFASEMFVWHNPHLRGSVPDAPEKQVLDMMGRGLERAVRYLDPIELEHIKRTVLKGSWAYNLLNPK